MNTSFLPYIFLIVAIGVALLTYSVVMRLPHPRPCQYWSCILFRLSWMSLILIVSLWLRDDWLQSVPFWNQGYHIYFDLLQNHAHNFILALWIPGVIWGVLLIISFNSSSVRHFNHRWIAGFVGFESSKRLALWLTIPLLLLIFFTKNLLGGGDDAYPAAAWSLMVVLSLTLMGVGFCLRTPLPPPNAVLEATTSSVANLELDDWPRAIIAAGIRIKSSKAFGSNIHENRQVSDFAKKFASKLDEMGVINPAPELVDVMTTFLEPTNTIQNPNRIIFAPDNCGQAEILCLTARMRHQMFRTICLVVVPDEPQQFSDHLSNWMEHKKQLAVLSSSGELPVDAFLWVVDAKTLSDCLLPKLRENQDAAIRIELLVWWNLHAYSGVRASNLWAIAMRLYRILNVQSRKHVRTLAMARSFRHNAVQISQFVKHLLPVPFSPQSEIHVQHRFAKELYFHRMEIPNNSKEHPLLTLTRASLQTEWHTCLIPPVEITASELESFYQEPYKQSTIRDHLVKHNLFSGVSLMPFDDRSALTILDLVCQSGRYASEQQHHVVFFQPSNPYAAFLLDRLLTSQDPWLLDSGCRLVASEANKSILRRHLLMFLNEVPATRSETLSAFRNNGETVLQTLASADLEKNLNKKEIRYLNAENNLVIEPLLEIVHSSNKESCTLDSVGPALIRIKDVAGGTGKGSMQKWLDPERLTIQAYPNRIFMHQGERYRILPWDSVEQVIREGKVACQLDNEPGVTWRVRTTTVDNIKPLSEPVRFGQMGALMDKITVSLTYTEEITETLMVCGSAVYGNLQGVEPKSISVPNNLMQSFSTHALILGFSQPSEDDDDIFSSLAHALRCVLPIHMGVQEDDLELVVIHYVRIGPMLYNGLAIVDLFPSGVGLIDAIAHDNQLILTLLERAKHWLENCSCQSHEGCSQCLRTTAARAATGNMPFQLPFRGKALQLLRTVI